MSDDGGFSDDDLDALPANAIAQYEAAAVQATQRPPAPDSDSDYGLDDGEEVINLDALDAALYDTHGGTGHGTYAGTYAGTAHDTFDEGTTIDEGTVPDGSRRYAPPPSFAPSQADPDALLLRIKKLEQDKARERRDAADLHDRLQTKAGEADTLRRRHDAELRRHARVLADQQQHHGDELAKLRSEIDRLRREKEQASTNHAFHQHDVRDAAMAPRTRKPMAARPRDARAVSPAGTPGRRARGPLADGFDDADVVMASPSRTRDRPRTATPSLAGKRKRNVADASPIPLQLSAPPSQRAEKEVDVVGDAHIDAALLDYFRNDDGRFRLLHRLLAHTAPDGTDRVLEALAQHAFPSEPSKRLSSIFYDVLAAKPFADVHALALDICYTLCDLWARCLAERHYAPVNLLLDALHFVLSCERCETACKIKGRFVPLMIDSIDLVANPLSKAAKVGPDAIATLYASGHRQVTAQIDVLDCLEVLHLIATSCVGIEGNECAELWQSIPSDFALMLLNKEQPIAQISLMLRILATSALPSSIGPIAASASQSDSQATREDALIGRLTNLFTETPTVDPDPHPPFPADTLSHTDTLTLRLQVTSLLTTLATHPSGTARLAQNPIATGRLLKTLDRLLASLYSAPLSPAHAVTIASINATMKLVFLIVNSSPAFDLKAKLANTLGGQHAFLVGLTRLAFSEGLVLEKGVEEGVVDMAHWVLDGGLSLEEGEAFGGVFGVGSSAA